MISKKIINGLTLSRVSSRMIQFSSDASDLTRGKFKASLIPFIRTQQGVSIFRIINLYKNFKSRAFCLTN